jgi:replicative DNA helicase
MMQKMEQIILKNLLKKEPFLRKALPYLKPDYFHEKADKVVFEEILEYVNKYNVVPDPAAININVDNRNDVFDTELAGIHELIDVITNDEQETDQAWLADATEKFCQEKALYNGVSESIQIMEGKSKKDKGSIPQILQDALAVTFDPNVGHDYLDDADARYAFYHRTSKKYPFDLDFFNRITGGGLEPKTLTCILAPPNAGKSLMMCHFAAAFLAQHFNVLYITMEMAQEKIAMRIDANLMDVEMADIKKMSKKAFDSKVEQMKSKYKGKLVVKEYPTAAAGCNHFRALLNELAMKKQFRPDIVIIDYINICSSSRLKLGNSVNSYTLIKSIAEEMRGLAMEFNLPIITATQTTRSGATNSDPDMTDTSESFGLPATVDNMWAIITSEELAKLKQIVIKQIKNRDNDVNENRRFVLGVNRHKMRLYDVGPEEQTLVDANQLDRDADEAQSGLNGSVFRGKSTFDKFRNLGAPEDSGPINRFS